MKERDSTKAEETRLPRTSMVADEDGVVSLQEGRTEVVDSCDKDEGRESIHFRRRRFERKRKGREVGKKEEEEEEGERRGSGRRVLGIREVEASVRRVVLATSEVVELWILLL